MLMGFWSAAEVRGILFGRSEMVVVNSSVTNWMYKFQELYTARKGSEYKFIQLVE